MTTTQPASQGKTKMLVSVVLDRSGSMASTVTGTISGYNEFLNGLKLDKETEYFVSLTQFDSPHQGPELTVSYADKPLDEVPNLDSKSYEPRGGTPLYDAIGECVRRIDAQGRAIMCVIITDGEENSSCEFTNETIKKLISEKEALGWKFVFLGANIDSYAVAGSMAFAAANVANYAVGNEHEVYQTVSSSAALYASDVRARGMNRMTATADHIGPQMRAAMSRTKPGRLSPARPTFPTAKPAEKPRTQWAIHGEVPKS